MPQPLAAFLTGTINSHLGLLRDLTEEQSNERERAGGWSRKEELGHLIDSAANNHMRFAAGAIQPEFTGPGYQQDEWVRLHGYADMSWATVVDFWYRYNAFLAGLVSRIPDAKLETPCRIAEGPPITLGFVIEDYVLHMQHHLDKILRREKITDYPGAALP